MKKLSSTTLFFVFLLFISMGIQAQSTQTKLNQVELAKQFLGTWQGIIGKDTVGMWEGKLYGEAVMAYVYMVIKGVKSDSYISLFGYDDRDDKLKGYTISPNSEFGTWIGAFTTDKVLKMDGLDTFKPEKIWYKAEFEYKTPTEVIIRNYNAKGIKTGEYTYKKIK